MSNRKITLFAFHILLFDPKKLVMSFTWSSNCTMHFIACKIMNSVSLYCKIKLFSATFLLSLYQFKHNLYWISPILYFTPDIMHQCFTLLYIDIFSTSFKFIDIARSYGKNKARLIMSALNSYVHMYLSGLWSLWHILHSIVNFIILIWDYFHL